MNKRRLIIDAVVVAISTCLAIYFFYAWLSHGLPLWGNENMMPGSKNYLFPWLSGAIFFFVLGAIAAFDFYIYKQK